MEVVLVEKLGQFLDVTESELRLDKSVLCHHDFVFMLFRLLVVSLWDFVIGPIFRLLRE